MQHAAGATHVRRKPRRKKRVVSATLALMCVTGVAVAFWTMTGSGTGTASTGDVSALTVNQDVLTGQLGPGLPAIGLSGDFDNPNTESVYVGTLTATITGVTGGGSPDPDGDVDGCAEDDYVLTNASTTVNSQIAAGTGVGSWSGPEIDFVDETNENQNACKGATVQLSYTLN